MVVERVLKLVFVRRFSFKEKVGLCWICSYVGDGILLLIYFEILKLGSEFIYVGNVRIFVLES